MSKKKDYYSNPLGEFAEEDFVNIKQEGNVDEFMSKFKLTETPCPPRKYRPSDCICMYCESCFKESFKKVKIRKEK